MIEHVEYIVMVGGFGCIIVILLEIGNMLIQIRDILKKWDARLIKYEHRNVRAAK